MHVCVYMYNSGAPAVTELSVPTPQPAQDDFLQIFAGRDVSVQGNMPKRAGEFTKTRCIHIYVHVCICAYVLVCAPRHDTLP